MKNDSNFIKKMQYNDMNLLLIKRINSFITKK